MAKNINTAWGVNYGTHKSAPVKKDWGFTKLPELEGLELIERRIAYFELRLRLGNGSINAIETALAALKEERKELIK
jgi:hypothetical protein